MRFFTLLWKALREIFDERGYERYLVASGSRRNRRSYGAYLDSKGAAERHKPRCC